MKKKSVMNLQCAHGAGQRPITVHIDALQQTNNISLLTSLVDLFQGPV